MTRWLLDIILVDPMMVVISLLYTCKKIMLYGNMYGVYPLSFNSYSADLSHQNLTSTDVRF